MLKYWAGILAAVGLFFTTDTALAQHGHGGGHGGAHFGGGHIGGGHIGGGHIGGFHYGGGHLGGYHPGYYGGGYHGGYYGGYRHSGFYGGRYGLYGFGYPYYGGYGLGLGYGYGYPLYGGLSYSLGSGYYGYPYYGSYSYPYYYGSYGYPYSYGGYSYAAPAVLGAAATTTSTSLYTPALSSSVTDPAVVPSSGTSTAAGTGSVTVVVPSGAQLWFDGKETDTGSASRVFTSQKLEPGQVKTLSVKARWDGSTREMQLPVQAGDNMTVDLTNQ